jgi:imidazolonepropionase-like amidohydrolase
MNRYDFLRIAGFALLTLVTAPTDANDQIPGDLPKGPVAILGGTVYPLDAAAIPDGVVLVEAGRITAVGPSGQVPIPAGAQVVDAKGKNVYPGMIDAYSDIGLREIDAVDVTVDNRETGRINPNVRSWVAINPDSELIPVARSTGVLTSLVAPTGPLLAGQAGVVRLDGWTWEEMLMLGPAAMVISWDALESRGGDDDNPQARAKAREKRYQELDDLLTQAQRYAVLREASPEQQPIDLRLEALVALARGQLPLIAAADHRGTIEAAVAYAVSRNLRLIIYGGHDAPACAELLTRHQVPVILPGTFRLPLRRDDAYDSAYTVPARLHQAGVKFCIAAERSGYPGGASNARNLPFQAGNAVAYGLDPNVAVRAITLSAAEILGVADQVGSLSPGKEATLLVVEGDLLEVDSQVRYAMIRGRPVDLGNKQISLYRKYQEKYRRLEAR